MPNKIVLRLDMRDCSKCKKIALHSVTQIEGIDSLTIDMKESTLTVIGDADPACMCTVIRKKFKCAHIILVGPPPKPEQPKPPPPPTKTKCKKCGKEFDIPKKCPACKEKCKCKCKPQPRCDGKCNPTPHPSKAECEGKCKCKPQPPCDGKCNPTPPSKAECEGKCKAKCNPTPPTSPKKPCEKKPDPPTPTKPDHPAPTSSEPAREEKCKGKCNPPCSGCSCILVHCCPRRCACSSQQVDCYPPCCGCSSGSQILWPRYNNPGAPGEVWYVWDEERQGACVIM